MVFLKKIVTYFFLWILISCQSSMHISNRNVASLYSINNSAQQLVTWETQYNAVSHRSDQLISVEHYEIPLRLLKHDFESSIDEKTKSSLIFIKNGEPYVRWLINPEDSLWHLEVKGFLEKNHIDSTPKKFFDGYLTASRSMILVNPENGVTFSLKVSTNKTGGRWTDKKQTWKDARQVRKMNKYVKAMFPKMENETLVILNEPLAMGIEELDQGMVLRSLNAISEDTHYYMPAFSALHGEEGLRIAKLNGSNNPVSYWEKHMVVPVANAMAEFFSKTGAWYDSPHAQNFLIELDLDMKPTGRIILRDLGDSYLLEDFVKNTPYAWIMENWEAGKVVSGKMNTGIGLLHGNTPPSWMTVLEYKEYGWTFYRTFEKRFSELTKIPIKELIKIDSKELLFSYSNKIYPTSSPAWKNFTQHALCMSGASVTLSGEKCPGLAHKLAAPFECGKAALQIMNH
jgi:hypothetical protein